MEAHRIAEGSRTGSGGTSVDVPPLPVGER